MATRSNKHANVQHVVYPGFTGGLNLSVSPENLAKNELNEALNVEYSSRTGSMRVRGGLVWRERFSSTVQSVIPISGRKGFLVKKSSTRWMDYFCWNTIWPVSGSGLFGSDIISSVTWEDASGQDCWLIASGNLLQKFTDSPSPKLMPIVYSPSKSRLVFVRNGRVGVVCDTDTIFFSAVGNCESASSWTNDKDDESSAQWIDIGYKDGMDITAVVPLSKDLIIFKNPPGEPGKGTIWRLTGDFPGWVAVEVAHNTGTFSQESVCVVGNDIFYATPSGIATLSNVMSYGEVKTGWPDRKVSNVLTAKLHETMKMYNISVKQQLWIVPTSNSKEVWVLDYGHGIWTTFEFQYTITYAFGVEDRLFVFTGRDVYEVDADCEQDNLRTTTRAIKARLKLGILQSGMQTLIKGIYASFGLMPQCEAVLKLGKFEFPFTYAGNVDYIYDPPNDTQYASEDDDPLFPEGVLLTARRKCIVRDWMFEPVIEMTGGGCSVSNIGLEVVEV